MTESPTFPAKPYALSLGAIALWATLASLGVSLAQVPPFLLTGLSLLMGSVIALPLSRFDLRLWRVPARTLALGVYGLFGFHFLLFMALRLAPAVEANLINYLWPLLMVVLAPVLLPGLTLTRWHALAALMGFAGAALAIAGAQTTASAGPNPEHTSAVWGYVLAGGSALVWSTYSLLTRRVAAFPTAAIGSFGCVSGVLSLLCHWLLEPAYALSGAEWLRIAVVGLGPLGAAFFLWDAALKRADPRTIGILSYLTPLGSTALLLLTSGRPLNAAIAAAAALILGAGWLGMRQAQA